MGVKPNDLMDNRRRKRTSQKEDRGIERVSVTFTYPGNQPEVRASFQHLRLFSCFDLILNSGAERASDPFTEITLREGVNHNYLAARREMCWAQLAAPQKLLQVTTFITICLFYVNLC